MELFAWQGLRIEHPEDWAPVVLAGSRKEGYARLAGPGATGCQLRWQQASAGVDLNKVLSQYLDRLQIDAKRAKLAFSSETRLSDEGLCYRWTASEQARGTLLFEPVSSRVVFQEVFGGRKDQLLPVFRRVSGSLGPSIEAGCECWSLFGLKLQVPSSMNVLAKKLESGRTTLELGSKKHWLLAQRWSFAEQLIQRHGLEAWTLGLLGKRAQILEANSGSGRLAARYAQGPLRARLALVQHQIDRNQLIVLRTLDFKDGNKWPWDWIA